MTARQFCMRMVGLILATGFFLPETLTAQEGGQKKYGVIHNIAEDRQVERVGGIYEPEGLDKYMKRKFDGLGAQIEGMNGRINEINERLEKIEALLSEES